MLIHIRGHRCKKQTSKVDLNGDVITASNNIGVSLDVEKNNKKKSWDASSKNGCG